MTAPTTGSDSTGHEAIPYFDPGPLRSWSDAIAGWFVTPPRWLVTFFRECCPIPRICLLRFAAVTRYDDVAEVLSRPDVFNVPFGGEIARLNDWPKEPGTPFILGIDHREDHDKQLKLVMQAFRRSDVDTLVTPICRRAAQGIVQRCSEGRLDAIPELITRVPMDLCEAYYGVQIPGDLQKFAYATIAVSAYLFNFPSYKSDPDSPAEQGAAYVRWVVDTAIDREMRVPTGDGTVLGRLVAQRLDRLQIRAFLVGMIVGFVPTNTMAGGHILEMLLRKPRFLDAARAAALAGDDDLLGHCLFEAMRFMPLSPGPFRLCVKDYKVAAGTRRAATIREGTRVLASTMSAMFDPRRVGNPRAFDPARPAADYMLFGYGMHWCAGNFIARAQITQTFKALLLRPDLERAPGGAGKLKLRGGFPDHLSVVFHPE